MRKADFTGPRRAAAADERDVRDRVMRGAKRTLGQQADAGTKLAGDRVDRGGFDRFFE